MKTEITSKSIFAADQVLTLEVAKSLVGKRIAVTSPETKGNSVLVRIFTINGFISEWDNAADVRDGFEIEGSQQAIWNSTLSDKRIKELKNTLLIQTEHGTQEAYWLNVAARCNVNNPFYLEATFTGSDADREVYYIVIDNEN